MLAFLNIGEGRPKETLVREFYVLRERRAPVGRKGIQAVVVNRMEQNDTLYVS